MRLPIAIACLLTALPAAAQTNAPNPQAVLDELVAAERTYSNDAAQLDPVTGISAMFADDVAIPSQSGLLSGRSAALSSMRANPGYRATRARWRPIRAGVSADGRHGFTYGYLDLEGAANPERAHRRYLAYWVRGNEGWRVAAWRQVLRPTGEAERTALPNIVPPRIVAVAATATSGHAQTLRAAEQAFSDRAQRVGLRAAFAEFGRADSMNMGSPQGFVIGADAISRGLFDTARTSPLNWSADRAIVASSGDLGVTIGTIRQNGPAGARAVPQPFFTIWHRAGPGQPWRYIAE